MDDKVAADKLIPLDFLLDHVSLDYDFYHYFPTELYILATTMIKTHGVRILLKSSLDLKILIELEFSPAIRSYCKSYVFSISK